MMLLALHPFTAPLEFNGGLGDDGQEYARMVQALKGEQVTVEPPFVYRIGAPLLVAMSGFDTKVGFFVLNILASGATGTLLFALLRRYRVSTGVAYLCVIWWSALPFGLRFVLYYPVLLDGIGMALLCGALYAMVSGRLRVAAAVIAVGVLFRENLMVLIPFVWFNERPLGAYRAALRSAAVGMPAAVLLGAVHVAPPVPPSFMSSIWTFPLLHLQQLIMNTDLSVARLLVAGPGTLGMFLAIPILRAPQTWKFLREEPAWTYYLAASVALAIAGGRDDDRIAYLALPSLAVLTFAAAREERFWKSVRWCTVITALHLIAVRFLWPIGTDRASYLNYGIAWMEPARLALICLFTAFMYVVVAILLFIRSARATTTLRRDSFSAH